MEDVCGATDVAREQVVQRIRELLRHAPADRAWRRRCWLVMLRARTERERRAHSVENTSSSSGGTHTGGERVPKLIEEGGDVSKNKHRKTEGGGDAMGGGLGRAAAAGETEVARHAWNGLLGGRRSGTGVGGAVPCGGGLL